MPNPYELAQERAKASEALDTIDYYLRESFDLDGFSNALRKPSETPVFEAYEQRLPFAKLRAFEPVFYSKVNGVVPAPLELLDIAGAGTTFDKREDLHLPGHNYKIHGARFAVLHTLNIQPEARIMATASAGNHGISVAAAVNQVNSQLNPTLQREAHIYCRENISAAKKDRLKALGARIFAHYETLEDAMDAAQNVSDKDTNYALIHPFDDPLTMAGQATIEFETFAMLKARGIDLRSATFRRYVPVGGGGYLAGTAYAWSRLREWGVLSDASELIGVEVEHNDSISRALHERPGLVASAPYMPDGPNTLDTDCDGTATLRAGQNTLPIIREHTNGVRVISKEYLIQACGQLINARGGRAPELAGALSLGGLLHDIDHLGATEPASYNVTTTTGSNITSELLQRLGSEWVNADCNIKTKVAALALRRAAEGLAPPLAYHQKAARSNNNKSGEQNTRVLNVWKGYSTR